jgi:hypothetical protein
MVVIGLTSRLGTLALSFLVTNLNPWEPDMSAYDDFFEDPDLQEDSKGMSEPEDDAEDFPDVEILRETDKAWHVRFPGNPKAKWCPKSKCCLDKGTLSVPEWLLEAWEEEDGFSPDRPNPEDYVEFSDCICLKESEKALWVQIPGRGRHWVPKSQVLDTSQIQQDSDQGTLVITAYIANAKELTGKSQEQDSGVRTVQDDIEDENE